MEKKYIYIIIGLVILILLNLVNIGTNEDNKSINDKLETAAFEILNNENGIFEPSVSIDSDGVSVRYLSHSSNKNELKEELAAIIGIYSVIILYTETEDLFINVRGINTSHTLIYRCKKSWIEGQGLENSDYVPNKVMSDVMNTVILEKQL